MTDLAQSQTRLEVRGVRTQNTPLYRHRPLYVLFVHRDLTAIDSCLRELKKGQFAVSSEFVLNPTQCAEQLRSRSYDVIVVEYPSPACPRAHELQLLRKTLRETPLVLLTTGLGNESRAELTASGAFEYVEQEHIAQLPMAVRRALNDKKLREELGEVRQALQHSQSLYRALVDNPAYGIYRCDAQGNVRDVNQALMHMLGYASKDELLSAHQLSPIFPDLRNGSPFVQPAPDSNRIDPIETDWKRKDGTLLKARISGRGVYDDRGNFAGHEIIALDITEQRTLEEELRHQASTDSLTGLANHRRLFEALHAEICRSKRTGREFSLLMLDLDGLKKINDQFGHLVGNRALCRLGQILRDCCRSIDTAARHGGDEFAVVLPETGIGAATLVARRICELLDADGEAPVLSVSLGIASYPREADTIGTLLYAADKALYAMKDQRVKSAQTLTARSGG